MHWKGTPSMQRSASLVRPPSPPLEWSPPIFDSEDDSGEDAAAPVSEWELEQEEILRAERKEARLALEKRLWGARPHPITLGMLSDWSARFAQRAAQKRHRLAKEKAKANAYAPETSSFAPPAPSSSS